MVLTNKNKKEMTIDFRLKQLKKIEMNGIGALQVVLKIGMEEYP